MKAVKYADKEIAEVINDWVPIVNCLIVTTTDVETAAFRECFEPVIEQGIIRCFYKTHSFFIGRFGKYLIGHVQCAAMGGITPGASLATVNCGIDLFKPKAIIMPGIAFGIDSKKQKIGDVLVSHSIIPYNIQRVSKDETQYRGNIPFSGAVLFDRFKNAAANWHFQLKKNVRASVIFGKLLSGEALVDNLDYRQTLTKSFSGVIGGEMEGTGVFAAAHEHGIEWIVVKSICDFADGDKGKNKDHNQKLAAKSSVSLVEHVLSINGILEQLKITDYRDRRSRREIFDENWPMGSYKHFEILQPVLAVLDANRAIKLTANIKNLDPEDIGTCYIVIKLSVNGDHKNLIFNTDIDYDEEHARKLKIYDIYPGGYKTFKETIRLPQTVYYGQIQIKIEVWSPAREYHTSPADVRIALFDKTAWQDVS